MDLETNTVSAVEEHSIQTAFARAGFADRFFANMVDGIIFATPLRLTQLALAVLFHSTYVPLINLVLFLIVYFWYFSYFPYNNNGQTLGKRWLKIRIAKLDGSQLSLGHFVARDFAKNGVFMVASVFSGLLSLLWLLTYLLALAKDRRALHDIIARTQVIKE